jgi:hypothetical protein
MQLTTTWDLPCMYTCSLTILNPQFLLAHSQKPVLSLSSFLCLLYLFLNIYKGCTNCRLPHLPLPSETCLSTFPGNGEQHEQFYHAHKAVSTLHVPLQSYLSSSFLVPMAAEPEQPHVLGRNGQIQASDNLLTVMVRRLEAATSRLEDIASTSFPSGESPAVGASNGTQSPGPAAKLAASTSATPMPKPPTESAPPAVEAYDEMANTELKAWLELSSMLGEVIEGQSKAVQQAFAAQRQFIFIANKAKKPDDRTIMELLKDLQASMEKTDEFRQQNREAALKDPLSMVADGVGCLGWITISSGSSMKPHEHIKELFGGAQMYGNKVLKEYRDKYENPT